MDRRIVAVILLFSLSGLSFAMMPGMGIDGQHREGAYPVFITAKGNMTLTEDSNAFNITVESNFTAMIPIQLAYGNYSASFSGEASISNDTIKFRGELKVDEHELHVSFKAPNTYPEIPLTGSEEHEEEEHQEYYSHSEYKAEGKLDIEIMQISTTLPVEKTWIHIKGTIDSYGGDPAFGWLRANVKLGQWAKVNAFFAPVSSTFWDWEDKHLFSEHNANVTLEGNMTLTSMGKSFDLTVATNFTAKVPEEVNPGIYNATYEGAAYVSKDNVQFLGHLNLDDDGFFVSFTIPNVYQDLPLGSYVTKGKLTVSITKHPITASEYAFYAVTLVNATLIEANLKESNLHISGFWDVYKMTWAYSEGNLTYTIEPIVKNGTGEFNVTDGWKTFTLKIEGAELISGKIFYFCYRSFIIPHSDLNGDYTVDIFDMVHIAKRYGTTPGKLEFDFDSDLNDDFNIDIYDLTTIAANLGEEY